MSDQLFQQLLDSIAQMTEIIKKQQETIDKLLEQQVEYKVCEKVVQPFPDGFINTLKTTGVGEQKNVATCSLKRGFDNSDEYNSIANPCPNPYKQGWKEN